MSPSEIFDTAFGESLLPAGLDLAESKLWYTARVIHMSYHFGLMTKERCVEAKKAAIAQYRDDSLIVIKAKEAAALNFENAERNKAIELAVAEWNKHPTIENGDALVHSLHKVMRRGATQESGGQSRLPAQAALDDCHRQSAPLMAREPIRKGD